VEFRGKVRKVVVAGRDLFARPIDLFQLELLVITDLGDGGQALEAGVPGSALAAIEAASVGRGVGEGRVDDVSVAYSKDQLMDANAGEQAFFAEETSASRVAASPVRRERTVPVSPYFGALNFDGIRRCVS
jgi:hypothetical protein